jgi:hypothetical protein
MTGAKKYMFLVLALAVLTGCRGKKKVLLSGEEPVEAADFIGFFQPVNLSFQLADSSLQKKDKDSLLISYKVFTQFVPDSLLSKVFGKGVKPKMYPLGKAEESGEGVYLFVKAVTPSRKAAFILAFNKKEQYVAGMSALLPDQLSATSQSVVMDRKYTITKTMLRRNTNGSINEGKDVYVLNAGAKNFMLIMTDALEDKMTELINPIDTLPRKHKLSADYTSGKMNLVSIRDGRRAGRLSFFIHFEQNNGECTGELKGEAMIKSSSLAEYRQSGDPCVLKFIFSSSSVTLKEQEGCGSHRGLRCSFDRSFPRKKYVKPAAPKKTVTKK